MKKTFIISILLGISTLLGAQNLKTGLMMDNYLFSYRENPAMRPDSTTGGFFALGIGDIQVAAQSNLGLSSILFPVGGQLVTGFNEAVPADKFLGGLKKMNTAHVGLNENILAIGARNRKKDAFSNFELNLRSDNYLSAPKSIFEALKSGSADGEYKAGGIAFETRNYLEAAYGRSKKIGRLTYGWKAKALVGIVDLKMDIDELTVVSSAERDVAGINAKGTITAASGPLDIGMKDGNVDLDNIEYGGIRPGGFGLAADLGATYEIDENLTVGASLCDLGAMVWKTNVHGELNESRTYNGNNIEAFGDDLDDIMDDFKVVSNASGSQFRMIPLSFNADLRYKPVRMITLGAMGNVTVAGNYTTFEIRGGAGFTPFRLFNIAATAAYGTGGAQFGTAVGLRLGPFYLHAGADAVFFRYTPQYVPVNQAYTTVSAGLAIAF